MYVLLCLTFLGELDVGLSPPIAVLHIARVVAQVALLQRVNGQGDGNFLLPQMLPDCPAGGRQRAQERGRMDIGGDTATLAARFVASEGEGWGLAIQVVMKLMTTKLADEEPSLETRHTFLLPEHDRINFMFVKLFS